MATLNYGTVADTDCVTIGEATFTIDGQVYTGIESLKWTNGLKGNEPFYGASRVPLAETSGTYEPSCEFSINLFQFRRLIRRLGANYQDVRFNIVVNLRGIKSGLATLRIPLARIIEDTGSIETKNLMIPVKCSVLGLITLDGQAAVPGVAVAASSFGGSGVVTGAVGASGGISG